MQIENLLLYEHQIYVSNHFKLLSKIEEFSITKNQVQNLFKIFITIFLDYLKIGLKESVKTTKSKQSLLTIIK